MQGSRTCCSSVHVGCSSAARCSLCCRDVFNEKPTADELVPIEDDGGAAAATLPRGAIIHTTRGDIWVRLFPDECPKVPSCHAINEACMLSCIL